MEHQPFEQWILDDAALDSQQERELQAHLLACAACRKLQAGWHAARAEMRFAVAAAPRPGFSQRFQHNLAERKFQQQLQTRRTLLGLSTGVALLILIMAGYILLNTSAADILTTLLGSGMAVLTTLHALRGIVMTWINIIPAPLALAVWIPLSIGFVILVAGWAFTLWRVTTQGVENT